MTDVKGSGVAVQCNDRCGCPTPCPGGTSCRCETTGTKDPTAEVEHLRCSCGQHCGCNPCTCSKAVLGGTACNCGSGCTCATCAA